MILVLGGTTEGRILARYLQEQGFTVRLTTVSLYGVQLARQSGIKDVQGGELKATELTSLLQEEGVKVVFDATHPYAENIRSLAQKITNKLGIPYGRYERDQINLPEHHLLHRVAGYEEAAAKAATLGENIFLAIGSRRLGFFTQAPTLNDKKLMVRVLPETEVLKHCQELGLSPQQIIAAQGPFSKEANLWMFRHFNADVVVSKESGTLGGLWEKWAACLVLSLPLVLIDRPVQKHPNCFHQLEDAKTFLEEVIHNEKRNRLTGTWQ